MLKRSIEILRGQKSMRLRTFCSNTLMMPARDLGRFLLHGHLDFILWIILSVQICTKKQKRYLEKQKWSLSRKTSPNFAGVYGVIVAKSCSRSKLWDRRWKAMTRKSLPVRWFLTQRKCCLCWWRWITPRSLCDTFKGVILLSSLQTSARCIAVFCMALMKESFWGAANAKSQYSSRASRLPGIGLPQAQERVNMLLLIRYEPIFCLNYIYLIFRPWTCNATCHLVSDIYNFTSSCKLHIYVFQLDLTLWFGKMVLCPFKLLQSLWYSRLPSFPAYKWRFMLPTPQSRTVKHWPSCVQNSTN